MNLLNFFSRRSSAPVARERLQILLAHERGMVGGQTDLVSHPARGDPGGHRQACERSSATTFRSRWTAAAIVSTLEIEVERFFRDPGG